MKKAPNRSILFILPDLEQGGAERVVTNLLNELKDGDFTLYLLLLRKQGHYLSYIPENVHIININKQRIRKSIFSILKVIRNLSPSIVFSGYGEVNAFISPFIPFYKKSKFIARETNVVSEHIQRKEIQFFYRFYKNYDTIIAQSTDMLNDLEDNWNIPKNKLKLIHNPVDVKFIQKEMKEFYPKEFTKDFKNVVSMGNLSFRKGFDELLQVFSFLKSDYIRLFIIGEGPQQEEFMNLKNSLNLENVSFLGKKKNPFPYLHNADLYILSSRYEGFPNALLEAGACGTYSLANNCKGGINEIIQEGINGEIYPITDHEGFAQKIKVLANEKHNVKEIENSISSRYGQTEITKQYVDLFNNIMKD